MLNKYQKALLKVVSGGDHSHLADEQDEQKVRDYLKDFPDAFARFLLVELSDNEDCDSDDEAVKRIGNIIDELFSIRAELEAACAVGSPAEDTSATEGPAGA